jgi:hypothetical protein
MTEYNPKHTIILRVKKENGGSTLKELIPKYDSRRYRGQA